MVSEKIKKTSSEILYQVAEEQKGLFTARQAVQAGYDERNHPYHVKSGNWIREQRGIYRLKNFPYSPDSQLSLWSLWSCNRVGEIQGVYSHETALQIYDLSDLSPSKLHMTVPIDFRRRAQVSNILVLHKNDLKPSEWRTIAGYRVTNPTRTLFDILHSDISKRFVNQVIREGLSRGLFPKQKLKKYKLIERVNALR
ncbi:MAG: type IV toxin-antitoxin system AbiEi family antitoxin domain-containing protein [Bdellovibrionales bacterium]|nr:type IV toxin-antitoxin system AbiEi family antitoxin domain-containing protein [Bdellovibrionales bacterium]